MERTADLAIVGAGVIGASVAFHLAARGCRNVVVFDRNPAPGQGSTARATGGFRAQFGTEINVRLSLLSRDKLRRFRDETGVDPGYRPCGYLFLAGSSAALAGLEAARTVQRAAGLTEARIVTPAEIGALNPAVRNENLVGGAFCPSDGFIQPMEILRGYVAAATRLGVRFEYGREITGFRMEGRERIATVRTVAGEYPAGAVVNAAGAWAAPVAAAAGVALPVRPVRRQVAVTFPTRILPEGMPMTIFAEDGFHFRVRDGRVLLLRPGERPPADPFDLAFDESWLPQVVTAGRERVPGFGDVEVDRRACWAGLYEMSPDHHALLGRAPGVENLYLANGSSGHGVMHAPALGQILSEMVLDGAASGLDVEAMRPSRFAEGRPNFSAGLL